MKPATALKLMRERAANSDNIVVLPHARRRMQERKVDFLQVQRCLLDGAITEGPYIPTNSRTGYWRCNVEATVTGMPLRAAVELPDESSDVFVVTVMVVG